jgi:hypothetical protein
VNLIAPAAAVIRAKDPNIIIISGALAPTGVNEPSIAQDDFSYLQAMVEAGMLNHVDCVGAHANGINLPPDLSYTDAAAQGPPAGTLFVGSYTNPHPSWSFYSTLNGYHDILVASGNSDVRLCVTEFGWASVEGMFGEPNEAFNFAYDNSLEDQAAYVTQAYSLMHDWGFVWLAFLFNLDFSPKGGGDPQDDSTLYSLMTGDGNPRPSFDAVRDMPKPP